MFVGGFIDCVITAKYATEHAAEEMESHTLQLWIYIRNGILLIKY